ncbi:alginate export family protein [Apibacter sp. HY039]|uniref:alginate export family protein n=1 Tax=Apibacter sp. HY039 TaxID=2501476 RepID=UPI000FEBDF6B|nr:alginate export family protein [Apibacter sp. HY039]
MKFKLALVCIFLLGTMKTIYSQKIQVGGEIRNRGELRNGFRKPLADSIDPLYVHNLRLKLYGSYTSEKFKAKVTLLDSKIFSSDHSVRTDNFFGIYEAWGEYFFNPQISVSAGRQILEYDDNRLFSAGAWSNTPNAHDLVKLKYNTEKVKVNVGGAWNNASVSLYNAAKSYESMFYGWGMYSFQNFNVSGIWVNEGIKNTLPGRGNKTSIYKNTLGGNIGMKNKNMPLSIYLTGYYQFGYDKADKKLDAFFLGLKNQYTFSDKIKASLGAEYLSGTSSKASGSSDHTFNRLYGAHHNYNGTMEYWIAVPTQGLVDIFAGADVKVLPKLSVNGSFHTFATAREIQNRNNKGIGSELDMQVDYKFSQSFSLQGGWSCYFKNKGTDILKKQTQTETRFPYWAYLMITYKPEFTIKTKNKQ